MLPTSVRTRLSSSSSTATTLLAVVVVVDAETSDSCRSIVVAEKNNSSSPPSSGSCGLVVGVVDVVVVLSVGIVLSLSIIERVGSDDVSSDGMLVVLSCIELYFIELYCSRCRRRIWNDCWSVTGRVNVQRRSK